MTQHDAQQGALFLGGDVGGLDLDGIGTMPTTPVDQLDLPRETTTAPAPESDHDRWTREQAEHDARRALAAAKRDEERRARDAEVIGECVTCGRTVTAGGTDEGCDSVAFGPIHDGCPDPEPVDGPDFDHAHITDDDAARCMTCVQHTAAELIARNEPGQGADAARVREMFAGFGWDVTAP